MVLLINACIPEKEQPTSDSVKVVISDRTFKIPKGYFDGRSPSGKDTESVVLEYSLPDFEVLPPHPIEREARQELINKGLKKGMLLEAERNRPPIEVSAQNLMRGRNYQQQEGGFYGLEKYQRPKSTGKYPTIWDDFFLEKDKDGKILGVLFCSPPNKDKNPGCNHTYMDKGLKYKIRWPIREFPNWKKQKQAAISFIDSLEIKKTEKE